MTISSMPNGVVHFALEDGVGTITLDRPESLNSMNDELMQDLSSALSVVEEDENVRVIVITGNGRGFCSGADLNNAADPDQTMTNVTPAFSPGDFFNPALKALHHCPVPTIARINGVAAGGGLGIALACDITIAVRSTFFVATFGPRLGIVPDMGSTWSLPRRTGRARAMGMAMLGDRISAEQAAQWGLIWKCVDDEELDAEVEAATETLKRTSPDAMVRIRQSIDGASTAGFVDQLGVEMEHQAVLIPRNMAEGAQAFLEKRDPEFDGTRN
ncbi:MAG: enoyl-CoA hydratase-related protein [Actinomycetota bacterium]|jgi:2-(1,2-epoxy-1,2-dihydrophenyl)acetyl-CoA isomerase|nr:enoyl-CoA hydratase-related protein [Actinomycetota bacterium]|tara:strand:- start:30 stop:845 length:816 start_codon:yes stop_codon:yes gene_type:complete